MDNLSKANARQVAILSLRNMEVTAVISVT
jgi:hypothetical protein